MPNGRKIIIVAIRLIIPRIERINLVPASRVTEGVKCVNAKLNQLEKDIRNPFDSLGIASDCLVIVGLSFHAKI